MVLGSNFSEYYDELFPVTEEQKAFFSELGKFYSLPVRYLHLGCGTGFFENLVAREGHDATGIDTIDAFLKTANLRRRSQLMSLRFFKMEFSEIAKYLGKKFYNLIYILDSRIILLPPQARESLFSACRALLSDEGRLVIESANLAVHEGAQFVQIRVRESLRARLFPEIWTSPDGIRLLSLNLETGNGRVQCMAKDVPVYPITKSEIESCARNAGFSSAEFYSGYQKEPFTGSEERMLAVLG